jgi:hypothetical protein
MDRNLQEYVQSFRIMLGRVSLPAAAVCDWFRQGLSYWMQEKLSGYVENGIDDLIEQASRVYAHCSVARASKIQGKSAEVKNKRGTPKPTQKKEPYKINSNKKKKNVKCTYCGAPGQGNDRCFKRLADLTNKTEKKQKKKVMTLEQKERDWSDYEGFDSEEEDSEKTLEQKIAMLSLPKKTKKFCALEASRTQNAMQPSKQPFKEAKWLVKFDKSDTEMKDVMWQDSDCRMFFKFKIGTSDRYFPIVALLDTGATACVINSKFTEKFQKGKNISGEQFDGRTVELSE